jgi:spore coat polysaccharide biosynthesis protein SpsF
MCDQEVTAILQGRIGSKRLPGKVLLPLMGKAVMHHVYDRLLYCSSISRIIVATSVSPEDDPIAELFTSLDVPVFRGSLEDPLDRYYQAACAYGASNIVRVMADCPLLDPSTIDEVVAVYQSGNYDLCRLEGEFPTGLDTTVLSLDSLRAAWSGAEKRSEREHITPFITDRPSLFRIGRLEKFQGLYHHRWVMDHPEDYQFVKMVYQGLYKSGQLFDYQDVLKFLDERPDVVSLNSTIPRDQGYISALSEETSQT